MSDDRTENNSPLVSVVLPTYGRPAFLPEAIESVVSQTYDRIELVIVDDGSPDPIAPIVRDTNTEDLKLEIIRHETNRGASAARNTGIQRSTGELVAFLDDDDIWQDTKIEQQVRFFFRSSNRLGVVYTGQEYIDQEGRTTNVRTPTTSGDVTRALLTGDPVNPFSCVMVRTTVIRDAGTPDERLPSWQDWEWYLRLSRHCTFGAIPDPIVVRRVGHDQIGSDHETKRDISYPVIIEKHRSLAADLDCEAQFLAHLSRMLAISALHNQRYLEANRHVIQAIGHDPTHLRGWQILLTALGGPLTYGLFRRSRHLFNRLRNRGVLFS